MGSRTIDEGSADEKSGMNYSEYMVILSGNTDLLDKVRLEKSIASLEGERKSFNKGRRDSESRLRTLLNERNQKQDILDNIRSDHSQFETLARRDSSGNILNLIQINGVTAMDEKVIGTKLQTIAKIARTSGRPEQIGTLYGFAIKVITDVSFDTGPAIYSNRFYIEGRYKY